MAIVPILRLASRLISTDCLLDYWYAVLCNETRPIANERNGEEQVYTIVELEEFSDPEDKNDDPLQEESPDCDRGPARISKRENENFELEAHEALLEDVNLKSIKTCEACEQDTEDTEVLSSSGEAHDQEMDDFAVFRKDEALSDADIAEVRSGLQVLAQNVGFVRSEMPRHTPAATQVYNEPITASRSEIGATSEGRRCYVIINTNLYRKIVDLYNEARESSHGELPRKYLFLSFHLAVSIVRKPAHVAHFVRFGFVDVPFENNVLSENGLDWENVIFGGLPYEAAQLIQWPCKMIMPLKDNTVGLSQRGEVQDDVMTYWDIHEEFILQLFRNEFWEVVVPQRGAEALKVPKGVEKTVTRTDFDE